jgi:hypothetical protein
MLDHRRRIARQLQFRSISGYDLSILTTAVDKEIALVEEGIQRIKDPSAPPAAERQAERQKETRITETSVAAVEPQEPASPLIDSVVELLEKFTGAPIEQFCASAGRDEGDRKRTCSGRCIDGAASFRRIHARWQIKQNRLQMALAAEA